MLIVQNLKGYTNKYKLARNSFSAVSSKTVIYPSSLLLTILKEEFFQHHQVPNLCFLKS